MDQNKKSNNPLDKKGGNNKKNTGRKKWKKIIKLFLLVMAVIFFTRLAGLYTFAEEGYHNMGFAILRVYGPEFSVLNSVRIVKGANPLYFRTIDKDRDVGKDNKRVYYLYPFRGIVTFDFMDIKSFTKISNGYFKDKNSIYHLDHSDEGISIIQGADIDTFEVLNNVFSKDKNNVYYEMGYEIEDSFIGIINDAEPASFEFINTECNDRLRKLFVRDKNQIYIWVAQNYKNQLTTLNLSPQNIEVFDKTCNYIKDNNLLYYYQEKEGKWVLTDIDAASLQNLNDPEYSLYLMDKDSIYFRLDMTKLIGADPADFTFIENNSTIAVSNNNIYCWGKPLEDVDANTFQIIKTARGYSSDFRKDKNHVYYYCELLKGADPNTFQLTGNAAGRAEDINNYYKDNEISPKATP